MKDDKTIYREFLEGSTSAFETLVIEHKDNLIYFISRYTGVVLLYFTFNSLRIIYYLPFIAHIH